MLITASNVKRYQIIIVIVIISLILWLGKSPGFTCRLRTARRRTQK